MDEEIKNDSVSPKPSKRFMQKAPWFLLIIGFVLLGFRSGYYFGSQGFKFEPKEFKVINQKDQPSIVDYSLFWKALDVINEKYIDQPLDSQKVLYGAIKGAVAASGDQYTEFFTPEDLKSFKTEMKGSFDGIGAEVGRKNGMIVVVAPLDDSPAQKAGIMAKDYILEVDGKLTADWTVEEAVKAIRGPRGSTVTLKIFRDSKPTPFEVKITRAQINIKSVKVGYKSIQGQQVGVITVTRFGDDTNQLFNSAVTEIMSKGVDKLVLDLRNNPGGYLESAVNLSSYWLPSGKLVVTEAHSEKDTVEFKSKGFGKLEKIKTVVLINGGSASASEILAGALQDYKIAKLIGEKSFGKGSVQELVELPGDSAVKVTVAKWITPGGKHLNKDGLVPDLEVKRTSEDIEKDLDPQMDKALEEIVK